ncbi:unnamed protein product, partial [Dicrocoelium dendriticum]
MLALTTTSTTIRKLRQVFSRFGIPETLVTDNGSQFTSEEFATFCHTNGVTHLRTPPIHPQSNGQVECFVDPFKSAIIKSRGGGPTDECIQTFLMAYRITPHPACNVRSPSEMLFGRQIGSVWDTIIPKQKQLADRKITEFSQHQQRGT